MQIVITNNYLREKVPNLHVDIILNIRKNKHVKLRIVIDKDFSKNKQPLIYVLEPIISDIVNKQTRNI